jgi:cardiolipin synthase A/B
MPPADPLSYSLDLQSISYISVLVIIHVYVALHILFTKSDHPTKTLLWLIVVIAMPVLGILLYVLFGINKLRTMRAIGKAAGEFGPHQKVLADYFRQQNIHTHRLHEDEYGLKMRHSFRHIMSRILPESLPLTGNSIELLHDGTETYPAMLEAIAGAQKSIHLQSFIIDPDAAGKKILDAMLERANAGVNVKIMYDRFGSLKAMISGFFHRYNKRSPENFRITPFVRGHLIIPMLQLRNHRKLLIIDGKTAFIGGVNIGRENDHNSALPHEKLIHDLHCRIQGPAVAAMQFVYLRDWMSSTNKPLLSLLSEDDFPEPQTCGESVVRVVPSGPGQKSEASRSAFRAAADTAQDSLWIFTPYFVPDPGVLEELCMASLRGVDVRLVVPANNNHFFVDQAAKSRYRKLLEADVRIFEKRGIFSHCKIMMVDGELIMMGSSNYDIRSFELNLELDIVIEHGPFIEQVIRALHGELEKSDEIDPATVFNKSPSRVIVENLFSLLSPIL